jgi:3-dehydroquinate synthase
MIEEISVPLGDRTYPILFGANILECLPERLLGINFPKRVALVTNPKVDNLYGNQVCRFLQQGGFSVVKNIIPDGEEYKSLTTLEQIYDELIANNFDRGTGLIALGGGVVGDIAGFAAATFLRGIPFVQIPTTLLAQVDSSVGGKTAVNHSLGKNLIGAFYQPQLVLIDVTTLNTLDPREVSAGLAEVIKYGIIKDSEFFCWLEENAEKLADRDIPSLITVVKRSCQIKADIVEVDEKEGSVRAYLNYGHTFGHAIEALTEYGHWKHGEAVAIGMVVAARISQALDLCSSVDVSRITDLLRRFNLPVDPPDYSLRDYVTAMQRDKKVSEGTLTLILNQGIGRVVTKKIPDVTSVFTTILKP